MSSILFEHAQVLDCTGRDPQPDCALLVEDGRIAKIGPAGSLDVRAERVVDCAGRTLMPGLIDAHAHLAIVDFDVSSAQRLAPAVYALRVARNIEATLAAGFTSVRDAGGLDWGYKDAAARGLLQSPRLFICNSWISQTGGHGDFRRENDTRDLPYSPGVYCPSLVVDGPERVRWAAREVLRRGADQVKVMANGGAVSPTDDMWSTQFTVEELGVAVSEAEATGKYVMAHTYTPQSMRNCVQAGVRTLEHGNFLDEETAQLLKTSGTYLVPTVAVYEMIALEGRELGVPEKSVRKIEEALAAAYMALEVAHEAGVMIGSGSDLLGAHQPLKARELQFKARVLGAMGALVASTATNAAIIGMEEDLGTVEEGKLADLLVVDGDPTSDIAVLEELERVQMVVRGGEVMVERGEN